MNFSQFQATGRDVADLREYDEVLAQLGEDRDAPMPGRLYLGALYIELGVENDAPVYHLTIGNRSTMSADLAALERELFDFAVSEGYIDGPTTEEELIDALQGLMNYVGGWDAAAGHPCRIAADLLARIAP